MLPGRTARDAVDGRDLESQRPDAAWLDKEFAETGRPDHGRGIQSQGRIEHSKRRAGHSGGWAQRVCGFFIDSASTPARRHGKVRRVKTFRRSSLRLAAALCVLLSAGASSPLRAQVTQAPPSAPARRLPRLPGGRPDLQGLWLKSAGGFQGLFIGSLDGTNLAAGGARGGGRGGRGGPRRPDTNTRRRPKPRRMDRLRRGYEDPEARCHLPGVPRALDQPAGLYPVQIIQDEKYVALLHEAMHDVRIIPTDNSPHPKNYWAWDGDSRGRWEGDTFVVDVSNFNGRTWLDMAGQLRRRERTRTRALHADRSPTPSSMKRRSPTRPSSSNRSRCASR